MKKYRAPLLRVETSAAAFLLASIALPLLWTVLIEAGIAKNNVFIVLCLLTFLAGGIHLLQQLRLRAIIINNTEDDSDASLLNLRRKFIENALGETHGNIAEAAAILGYHSRSGLLFWIQKLRINLDHYK